jgi:hypothetical protein
VFSVGRSNERRELLLVAVGEPQNIRRLEEIRTTIARLRDPRRLSESEARTIAGTTPAIAWMNFANDGNESAAPKRHPACLPPRRGTDPTIQKIRRSRHDHLSGPQPDSHSRHVVG